MFTISIIFVTVLITWMFVHEFFYSPKAHIRRLWKEIFVIEHEISKYNSNDSVVDSLIKDPYEKALHRKERMINALLDYHFDPEEDQEFIEYNRPENKK